MTNECYSKYDIYCGMKELKRNQYKLTQVIEQLVGVWILNFSGRIPEAGLS